MEKSLCGVGTYDSDCFGCKYQTPSSSFSFDSSPFDIGCYYLYFLRSSKALSLLLLFIEYHLPLVGWLRDD